MFDTFFDLASKNDFVRHNAARILRLHWSYRPLEDYAGKSILIARQVEEVFAYLMTLKYDQ